MLYVVGEDIILPLYQKQIFLLIHAFSLSRFATAPSRSEPEFECLLDKPRPRGEVAALADGEGILPPTLTRLYRARTTLPSFAANLYLRQMPPSLTREGLM